MGPTLVVGNGMVGHRFVEEMLTTPGGELIVVGEEPCRAYDRVHLSSVFDGVDVSELTLGAPDLYDDPRIELVLGDPVVTLDHRAGRAITRAGRTIAYSACVLATGSAPFVPPVPGIDSAGVFVYRTLDDLAAIKAWAGAVRTGAVIGGGLLGLEAANALRLLGVATTVVEFAPRLMAVQLDEGGGRALRRHIETLGLAVRTGAAVTAVRTSTDGRAQGVELADGSTVPAELVIVAAGIRPRDQLARNAGIEIGERGGIVVDDTCRTSVDDVYAIGEVACHRGRTYGLVAPGYEMARVVADRLRGGAATFVGADTSTRLKLLGVGVGSVGDPHAEGNDVVLADEVSGTWQRVIVGERGRVLGAVLVGDVEPFNRLVAASRAGTASDVLAVLRPAGSPASTGEQADDEHVCTCCNVSCGAIRAAVDDGITEIAAVKSATRAGTGCGSCVPAVQELVDARRRAGGAIVRSHLCAHFAMTRPELYEAVRAAGIRTFGELSLRFGTGGGCEVCKPTAASIFASLASTYVLDGEHASLQDSNDHFLANLQRDGTYSVVPRVPGGEITPAQLITIGEVARDFELYTKVTGGQRIDLFGARVEQLPVIWARLRDAGLESGHAYGKAVRTVKSCVGSTWCRYGVQDSVRMAIDLELRYRGLRGPHKIKLAVSGCARECAEAQSKDVGVIATEAGWNLYVGGNGGMRPRHAELLATDLDDAGLVRTIDRYLMWYVRTAERLERTASWQRKLPGGIEYVRRVVLDDELGIGAELEADMARHVAAYECEWSATLDNPERLARFVTFVNTPEPDASIARVKVRGQLHPVVCQ